jgi:hypothetical protein
MGKRERVRNRQLKKKHGGSMKNGVKGGARLAKKLAAPVFHDAVRYDDIGKGPVAKRMPSVLVLGDGDFSFAQGLMSHRRGNGAGVVATSFDQLKIVQFKYGKGEVDRRLAALKKAGAGVLHGVDARKLNSGGSTNKLRGTLIKSVVNETKEAKSGAGAGEGAAGGGGQGGGGGMIDLGKGVGSAVGFDRVVFNFPHSGQQRVHVNRAMMRGFFTAAPSVLSPTGQVHVTIKMAPPYSLWNIEGIAETAGFDLIATKDFDQKLFVGYKHKTTQKDAKTFQAAGNLEQKLCKTLCFVRRFVGAGAEAGVGDGSAASSLADRFAEYDAEESSEGEEEADDVEMTEEDAEAEESDGSVKDEENAMNHGASSSEEDESEGEDSGSDGENVDLPFVDLDVPFSPGSVFSVRDSVGKLRTFNVADGRAVDFDSE